MMSAPSILASQTILVHAHRGGRAYRPENTLASFNYGIEVGADVLELDLAVTKDNVLVVSHSPFLTQPESDDPHVKAALAGSGTAMDRRCLRERRFECSRWRN